MKSIIFILAIFFSNFCFSQTNTFIRVYDLNDQKFVKGHLQNISDSFISITKPGKTDLIKIHYSKIGSIRLKRSFGHKVIMATVYSGISGGLIGAATASSGGLCFICTPTEGLLAGSFGGAVTGAVVASILGGIKSMNAIKIKPIDGDFGKWQIASNQLNVLAR